MAETLGERVLLRATLGLLENENEAMEARDDKESNFLSATRPLGAANEPTEVMAAKVDAIYPVKTHKRYNSISSLYPIPIQSL